MVLVLAYPAFASAQSTYVSPGFHIGYRFGEGGGLVSGVEVSIVQRGDRTYGGVVFAWDAIHATNNFHLGFEYGSAFLGACAGPVIASDKDTTDIGLRVTPYAGGILIPYYSYQFFSSMPGNHEVGAFLKWPIQTSGGPIMGRLGG